MELKNSATGLGWNKAKQTADLFTILYYKEAKQIADLFCTIRIHDN